jgi:hypothetical protein
MLLLLGWSILANEPSTDTRPGNPSNGPVGLSTIPLVECFFLQFTGDGGLPVSDHQKPTTRDH